MALCPHTQCECAKSHLYKHRGQAYETQDDDFRCGPVAILNALRASGRYSGRAQRRQIAVACNARMKHADDGFCGTKPPTMSAVVARLWPAHNHYVGSSACLGALEGAHKGARGIFLFRRPYTDSGKVKHYYHYVYAHREAGGWEFENSVETRRDWWKDVTECVYPRTLFVLPQLWILRADYS